VSGLFAYAAQFQKDEARDNHGRFSSGGGGMLAETAAKVKRIAQLQAERLAAGRGERVYGSPASSFEAIARAMLKKAKRGGGGLLGRRDRKPLAYPGVGQLSGERASRAHALSLSRYAQLGLTDQGGSSSHLAGRAEIAAPRSTRSRGRR